MIYSTPGSSVHGISQARTLEWSAISFSRDLPDPEIEPEIEPESPDLADGFSTTEPPGKLPLLCGSLLLFKEENCSYLATSSQIFQPFPPILGSWITRNLCKTVSHSCSYLSVGLQVPLKKNNKYCIFRDSPGLMSRLWRHRSGIKRGHKRREWRDIITGCGLHEGLRRKSNLECCVKAREHEWRPPSMHRLDWLIAKPCWRTIRMALGEEVGWKVTF